ncbi:formate dehydrogenase accessory sulfurtransferase FdhD [Methanobrevibacter sp. OttesenSCG-928-K11]|nr:formate dehydrogenase accessory sulfurtransferase FdhD [Methanobrevibacter sp. OttesenSCG-928-K11]MDL2270707.1 formate dehydrogenase accessory sulfurtransferase FdhD [Methanobrevibacter sp. OttesenSCG-928-I08]
MKLTEKVDAIKFKDGKKNEVKEQIVCDETITLIINDEITRNFSAINESLKEFTVGYLFGENIVKSYNNIDKIDINENIINVKIKENISNNDYILCSDASGGQRSKIKDINIIDSDLKVDSDEFIKNMKILTDKARIWKHTGGTHVAGIVCDDIFILKEDVSRHVAVDKAIGAGILEKIDFSKSYIIYSGRMPADMVIKLNRMKIPIIVSNAAPAYSGYEVVKKSNMTMIGFLRGNRFNAYGNTDRINFNLF